MRLRARTRYLIISLGLALAGSGGLWHVECGLLGAGAPDSLVSGAPCQLPTGVLAELRPIGPDGMGAPFLRLSDKISKTEPDNTANREIQPTASMEPVTSVGLVTPTEVPRERGDDDAGSQASGETAPRGAVQSGDCAAGATHKMSHSENGAVINIYHIDHVENLFVDGAPSPSGSSQAASVSQLQVPGIARPGTLGFIVPRTASGAGRFIDERPPTDWPAAISDLPSPDWEHPAMDVAPVTVSVSDDGGSPFVPAELVRATADAPPATTPEAVEPAVPEATPPISFESSLLSELGRAAERAEASAAPTATGVQVSAEAPAIDTTQLTRDSNATTVTGTRRAQVSIQPVIRGFQQQQIYAQYQGANFLPVRFDLDSMLSSIDPGLLDNLIIIPGPYGVKYGPGLAFIDMVPAPLPRSDEPAWHGRTLVNYQSNGQQFYGRETITGSGASYGIRATYGHKIGNDYYSGDGTQIPASYNVRDADLAFSVDLSSDSTFDFEYLRQDLTDTEYAGLMFDARFRKTDAFVARYRDTDWLTGELSVDGWYNHTEIAGDNQSLSKQWFYRDNFFFTSGGQTYFPEIGFVGAFDAAVSSAGFRVSPTWELDSGGHLTVGADFHYAQQVLNEFDNLTNRDLLFTPSGYENYPIPQSDLIDPGLFAELELPARSDLKFTAGVRVDWTRTDANPYHRAQDPDGLTKPIYAPGGLPVTRLDEDLFRTGLTKNDVLFSGFLTADQELDEHRELRLGFGHGQRPPSLTERYAYVPFLTVLQYAQNAPFGNPDLKPEQASQFDVALTGNYDDVRYRGAAFATLVDNFISYRYRPAPTNPAAEYLTFMNITAFLTGFELAGDFDLNEWWSPFADLSYLYGNNLDADEPLAGIYPLKSRVGLRFHEPESNRYGLELSVRMVGEQSRVARSLFEPTTPGFTVFQVRGHWQVTDRLLCTSGIENLTGRNYIEPFSVHVPPVFEPGFNFYLSMQLDY